MKKIVKENFRVEVYPDEWKSQRKTDPAERFNLVEYECQQIVAQIKRHVDGVGSVFFEYDRLEVCEFCGAEWTEETEHNGGCCDKDEEWMNLLDRNVDAA